MPLNTRFKGREAAYILGKAGVRALVVVREFLDIDYVQMLRDAVDVETELPDLETIVVLHGDAPAGATTWDDFLAAGDAVDPAESATRAEAVRPERPRRPPVHVGHDRQPQGRDADARVDDPLVPRLERRRRPPRTATATWS